jgi:hypothetical protein
MGWKNICNISDCIISYFYNDETVFGQTVNSFKVNFLDFLFEILFDNWHVWIKRNRFTSFKLFKFRANQVNESFRLKTSALNFLFGLNLDVRTFLFLIVCEDLACDNVSCPKEFTCFRAKLVDLFGNQLPKAFIAWTFTGFLLFFLQIIFFVS